mgnify:CR=1 FL=1
MGFEPCLQQFYDLSQNSHSSLVNWISLKSVFNSSNIAAIFTPSKFFLLTRVKLAKIFLPRKDFPSVRFVLQNSRLQLFFTSEIDKPNGWEHTWVLILLQLLIPVVMPIRSIREILIANFILTHTHKDTWLKIFLSRKCQLD